MKHFDRIFFRDAFLGIALSIAVWFLAPSVSAFFGSPAGLFEANNLVLIALATGVAAGFSTCMATVGGIVLALNAKNKESGRSGFNTQFAFHSGRMLAFAAGGFALGSIGEAARFSDFFVMIASLVTAIVLFRLGLALTGIFPNLSAFNLPFLRRFKKRMNEKGLPSFGPFTAGVFTFLLPCGFALAIELAVARSGESVYGAVAMMAFVIGTFPGLLILGLFSGWEGSARKSVLRVAGWLLLTFSFVTFSSVWGTYSMVPRISGPIDAAITSSVTPNVIDRADTDAIEIRIIQDGRGYLPKYLTLPKSSKIRLTVDSKNPYTCAADFNIPEFWVKKLLDPGENVFRFETPDAPAKIWFGCGMRMFQGEISVE